MNKTPSENDDVKILGEGRFVRLLDRKTWEFVQRKGASGIVVMIAITDDKKLVVIEQYREPVQATVIELPAGLVGDIAGEEDETMETAAKRELFEETGYEAENLKFLTAGPLSAGLSAEIVTLYLATGLKKTGDGGGDESESIEVFEVPLPALADWIKARENKGRICDPKIYAALYFAQAHLS